MILPNLYQRIIIILCGLYLIVFMHIYQPDMGGDGLRLFINISGWLVITIIIFIACAFSFSMHKFIFSRSLVFYIAAAAVLMFPLLYPNVRWVNTIGRMAGLIGGVLLYAILQQGRVIKNYKRLFLVFILLSVWVETVLALLQFFVFGNDNWMDFIPGKKGYGIFQQVNVLASYVATGIGICAWLIFDNQKLFRFQKLVDSALLLSLGVFSFIIVLLASRIGYLGEIAVLCILLGCFGKQNLKRSMMITFATVVGFLTAKWLLPVSWLESIAHEGSNTQRLMMLEQSLAMIKEKPWLGWGYGSFEYSFQHFVGAQQPWVINHELVSHPHNEILYWWVEGGVIALAGMVLIGIGYLMPLLNSLTRTHLALWTLTLPIALHSMTEFPFYLSVPHLFVLIILLIVADTYRSSFAVNIHQRSVRVIMAKVGVLTLSGISVLFFLTGVQTNNVLTQAEKMAMVDFSSAESLRNPYVQWRRFDYDKHLNKLMAYNTTNNINYLVAYDEWAKNYSHTYVDESVYLNRIKINAALYGREETNLILEESGKVLPFNNIVKEYLNQ